MAEHDLVIVGGGVGMSLAEAAVQKGIDCALIEEGKFGGTCLTRGCIPSKILVHPADLIREAEHAKRVGLSFSPPVIDWPAIARRMWQRIDVSKEIEQKFDNMPGVALYKGRAVFTGPRELQITSADGAEKNVVRGKRIILAPGARSFVPPVEGLEQTGYVISESFFGAKFPEKPWESLVILGGGAIGSEFAHIFSAMGTKVTIVERMSHLIPTEEMEIRKRVEKQFRAVGIEVLSGHSAISSRREGGVKILNVRSEETGQTREVAGDEILVSSGVRSNADRLQVEKAGIETDQRGWIVTDEYLRTSVPDIYALGDINGKFQFRHKANYEADILAGNLFSGKNRSARYDIIPWAIFTHPQVAHVGMIEEQAAQKTKGKWVGRHSYSATANGYAMGFRKGDPDDGFVKLIADENRRILGVHIVGPHAAILIQPFVYLMASGVSCKEPASIIQRAARRVLPEFLHSCLEPGTLDPIFETMVIHPSLSEVAAWVIGNLEWHNGDGGGPP